MTRESGVSAETIFRTVNGEEMGVITSVNTTIAGVGLVGDDAGNTMMKV